MATLRVLGVQLAAACALGLVPLTGYGGLEVVAPQDPNRLHRGDVITIEFKFDTDTLLGIFQFTPDYESFANILRLTANPTIAADIASGIGFCNAGNCSFFYLPVKSIPKDTVAARWSLRVTDNAPIGSFAFDLDLFVNDQHVQFPQSVQFNVVPEPAAWLSLVLGLAVLCVGYRRGSWLECRTQRASDRYVAASGGKTRP
jgi:hypothetical protein